MKQSFIAFIIIASLVGSTWGMQGVQAADGIDVALVRDSLSIYPSDVFQFDEVEINVTVLNQGDTDVDDVGIALYVNTRDNPVATQRIDIAAGEQQNITLYWFADEMGNHTLFVVVDYDDQFTETNEDNNVGSLVVDVRKPTYPPFPPASQDAEWWQPDWHYRVPVTVRREGHRDGFVYQDKMVQRTFDFTALMDVIKQNQTTGTFPTGAFDPDSVRVVAYARDNDTWYPEGKVGCDLVFSDDYDAEDNANVTVSWVLEGTTSPHEVRYYYVYWDTAGNGDISGAYGDIAAGIKNAEFEGGSTAWRNISEPTIGVPIPGVDDVSTWKLSTAASPTDPTDTCYRIYRRGIIWQEGWYGKVYQDVTVPDGGDASRYVLHAEVFFNDTVLDGVEWEITLDNQVVENGGVTGGWQDIEADVTSYLADRSSARFNFRVYVTALDAQLTAEVAGYLDACWLEVTPNPNITILSEKAHGWWGQIAEGEIDGMPVDQPPTYVAGVSGSNTIESINVSAVAAPREVMATLQYPAPRSTIARSSIPLPDAGFEDGAAFTTLFYSNEQTTSASFAGVSHTGSRGVELRLSDYHGKYKMLDQPVDEEDMVGFRQEVSQTMLVSQIPSLWFWYRV
ncbi:MAG: CARDB domain-containing protein, partial [Thermoplasmatota archaeon]